MGAAEVGMIRPDKIWTLEVWRMSFGEGLESPSFENWWLPSAILSTIPHSFERSPPSVCTRLLMAFVGKYVYISKRGTGDQEPENDLEVGTRLEVNVDDMRLMVNTLFNSTKRESERAYGLSWFGKWMSQLNHLQSTSPLPMSPTLPTRNLTNPLPLLHPPPHIETPSINGQKDGALKGYSTVQCHSHKQTRTAWLMAAVFSNTAISATTTASTLDREDDEQSYSWNQHFTRRRKFSCQTPVINFLGGEGEEKGLILREQWKIMTTHLDDSTTREESIRAFPFFSNFRKVA